MDDGDVGAVDAGTESTAGVAPLVGETFGAILRKQFTAIRAGDRYPMGLLTYLPPYLLTHLLT